MKQYPTEIEEKIAEWLACSGDLKKTLTAELEDLGITKKELSSWQALHKNIPLTTSSAAETDMDSKFYKMLPSDKSDKSTYLQQLGTKWLPQVAYLSLAFLLGWLLKPSSNEDLRVALSQQQNQMKSLKAEMIQSLLTQQAANQRIKAVQYSKQIPLNQDLLESFIKILNEDPNDNVRLEALSVLSKYLDNNKVQNTMVGLLYQNQPLIQLGVLDALKETNNQNIIQNLQEFVGQDSLNPIIKNQAENTLKTIQL